MYMYDPIDLLWWTLVLGVGTVILRFMWTYPGTYLPRWLVPSIRKHDPVPSWKYPFMISFAGMRGVVSLAAAMALPLTVPGGGGFPERDLVVFLSFGIILFTLVGPGLSMPWVIRRLGLKPDTAHHIEEHRARHDAAAAAVAVLDRVVMEGRYPENILTSLRQSYLGRQQAHAHKAGIAQANSYAEACMVSNQELHQLHIELISVERDVITQLRNQRVIGDETLRRVEHDLDLEEKRLAGSILI
jgi:monovalent cation/hydrogen antiporter